MRMVFSWKMFDTEFERESFCFHDRPKGGVKKLEGKVLEIPESWVKTAQEQLAGRSLDEVIKTDEECVTAAAVDWCERFCRDAKMDLKVVDAETYGRDTVDGDEFLVLVGSEEGPKMWFGYWEPGGARFLRDRGGEFPHLWVTPKIVDETGKVIQSGSEPAMVMTKMTVEELKKKYPQLAGAKQ